jgi:hypothetical protein
MTHADTQTEVGPLRVHFISLLQRIHKTDNELT